MIEGKLRDLKLHLFSTYDFECFMIYTHSCSSKYMVIKIFATNPLL